MTISYDGIQTYVIPEVITNTVFAMAFYGIGSRSSKKGLSNGAIAGIVLGFIAAVSIFVALTWILLRRKRHQRDILRRRQDTIEEIHAQPPEYPGETIVAKPAVTQMTDPIANDGPVSQISQRSVPKRKSVPVNSDVLMALNAEERAVIEAFRAEQSEKARKQRASELEEAVRPGEEVQGAQIYEVDAERARASELEWKT
jgi:hypothetical protein